ncbi:MAG TPA: hypothetical protein VFL29_01475 [Candidatus Dormibacteraeota bacterium]|nr:hypothetical protein [Candidatus Dormibacteraeota bacterium]
MKAVGLAAMVLLIAACGSVSTAAHPSPSPSTQFSPQPSPNPDLLVATLEAKGTANPWTYNTVVITDLRGSVKAQATFDPLPTPALGCMGAILPPMAHVVGNRVYYADGHGTIRTLAPDGSTATVARLPLTSAQQMLSFAISPDASRLLGAIFTAPANAFPCDGSQPTGSYSYAAYSGPVGGSMQLVAHQTWASVPQVMAFTGWDAVGPVGSYPSVWASQGGGPASTLGVKARIDPVTLRATELGSSGSCLVWDSNATGSYVCEVVPATLDAQQKVQTRISVRAPDGHEDWGFTVTDENEASRPFLSPGGEHVVVCCSFDPQSEFVYARDGGHRLLAGRFSADGWLDANAVYGWTDATNENPHGVVAYVALNAPDTIVRLGLSGQVVGSLSA